MKIPRRRYHASAGIYHPACLKEFFDGRSGLTSALLGGHVGRILFRERLQRHIAALEVFVEKRLHEFKAGGVSRLARVFHVGKRLQQNFHAIFPLRGQLLALRKWNKLIVRP
jgi:hypothetical protein